MSASKNELRLQLRRTRTQLTTDDKRADSMAIVDYLRHVIDWPQVGTLHCFEPIMQLHEVEVLGLVEVLQVEYPRLIICTSRQVRGTWQIVNLSDDQSAQDTSFDVIIVPMLGFDPKTLHRIGYGGGYYDKFLATQPQARKIGVCFEAGKVDQLPSEAHDVPLDMVVTEAKVYS